jgi:hypothetical protein
MLSDHYDRIVDPHTQDTVSILSGKGIEIMKNYFQHFYQTLEKQSKDTPSGKDKEKKVKVSAKDYLQTHKNGVGDVCDIDGVFKCLTVDVSGKPYWSKASKDPKCPEQPYEEEHNCRASSAISSKPKKAPKKKPATTKKPKKKPATTKKPKKKKDPKVLSAKEYLEKHGPDSIGSQCMIEGELKCLVYNAARVPYWSKASNNVTTNVNQQCGDGDAWKESKKCML